MGGFQIPDSCSASEVLESPETRGSGSDEASTLRGFSFSAAQCLVRCDGHSIASFVLGMAAMAQDVRHVDIVLGE